MIFFEGLALLYASSLTAIILTALICQFIIRTSNKRKLVDSVHEDLNLPNQENKNVPSFGGVAIIIATICSALLFADLKNIYVQLLLLTIVVCGGLGFIDDYVKIFKKSKKGISPKVRLLTEGMVGLIVALNLLKNENIKCLVPENFSVFSLRHDPAHQLLTKLPFVKGYMLDYNIGHALGIIIFILILIFIITGTSNAINLTDGIDGLALKNSILTLAVLIILSFVYGNKSSQNIFVPCIGKTTVVLVALFFSCLTCLWFNTFPAKIFMGDSGSLMLGGVISVMAIFLRIELFLPMLCFVPVVETLTVILQVLYFKYTKKKYGQGRRLFLLSPLHYHLIKKGWPETTTCSRLTLIAILVTLLSLSLLV